MTVTEPQAPLRVPLWLVPVALSRYGGPQAAAAGLWQAARRALRRARRRLATGKTKCTHWHRLTLDKLHWKPTQAAESGLQKSGPLRYK